MKTSIFLVGAALILSTSIGIINTSNIYAQEAVTAWSCAAKCYAREGERPKILTALAPTASDAIESLKRQCPLDGPNSRLDFLRLVDMCLKN